MNTSQHAFARRQPPERVHPQAAAQLGAAVTSLLVVAALTPLGAVWFARVSALPAPLVALAIVGLWLAAPSTGLIGIYAATAAMTPGNATQAIVLQARTRASIRALEAPASRPPP